MTLLNYDRVYFLNTHREYSSENASLDHRNGCGAFMVRDFVNDPENYFYFEFKLGNAFEVFPLNTLIRLDEIQLIKNKKAFLVVNNAHEAFHSVVDDLYKSLIVKEGLPPEQVILMTESADILNEIARVAAKYNLGHIKAEWILQFEYNVQRDLKHLLYNCNFQFLDKLVHKSYSKKYLNFNRRWRPHRMSLVALLKAYDLLDYGFVSLGHSDDNKKWTENSFGYIKHLCDDNPELRFMYDLHEENIRNLPPLYLDTNDLVTNRAVLEDISDYLYADSYFSVVTETNFFTLPGLENSRFLSEKTFKPVAMMHPFILVSVPNMLEKFKWLGYKSFSPYIDETYDTIQNDSHRLLAIIKEINRLCKLNETELSFWLKGIKEICEYNREVLLSKNKFYHKLNY